MKRISLTLAAALLAACATPPTAPVVRVVEPVATLDVQRDYHSYANTRDFQTEHLVLDLRVDFERRVLEGTVELRLKRLSEAATQLVLDTRDVDVTAVEAATGQGAFAPAAFKLANRDAMLGSALAIAMPAGADRVRVQYATRPEASGLQWVTPEQTAGKTLPFLYTQSQAIHARSWMPSQDTPLVRSTYEARIRTPKGLTAVMSAINRPDAKRDGEYSFRMPQPVPSYLIALAVGDIKFRPIGARTGIYAEASLVMAASSEFEDTEKMLEACEKLFGPYRWQRYDMLVLPPSFPYGGMENPRLTFLTPTAVVGDKSGVSLIAHELAHSWSGNLVTNATWRDFWLNEGTTTYLTYRIMDEVYGQKRGDMERVLGQQDLVEAFAEAKNEGDKALAYDQRGRDPDEVFSSIPYQRGQLLLSYLEQKFGRAKFDAFLRGWFDEHAFQSKTTEDFLAYLDAKLLAPNPGVVPLAKVEEWVYASAMPTDAIYAQSDVFAKVDAQRTAWLAGETPVMKLKAKAWSAHEWQHFLDNMPAGVPAAKLGELQQRFKLNSERNNYIAMSWLRQAIRSGYQPAMPTVERFLLSVGRMRFVNPLYRELVKTPEGKAVAQRVFAQARATYHPIGQASVERIIADAK
ncbi:MAG TPA: M1 family metallopeptidase [Verrucomicrobiae bacterium]|nr:M1 family metallopeptidase [Verrucomicrobiae bacterium]